MSKRMIDSELIESIESLGNSIRSDEAGNIMVGQLGKKVSIMGRAELVDGFEPIFTASIPVTGVPTYTIDVYTRKYDPKYNCYTFFGLLTYNAGDNPNAKFMVLGTYVMNGPDGSGNEIVYLSASGHNIKTQNPQYIGFVDDELRQFVYNKYDVGFWTTKYLTSQTGQPKLYRHHLFINGDTYWDVISSYKDQIYYDYQLRDITNAEAGDSFALDSKTAATFDGSNWSINGTSISSITDTVRALNNSSGNI